MLSQFGRSLFDALLALATCREGQPRGWLSRSNWNRNSDSWPSTFAQAFITWPSCIHKWRFDIPPPGINLEQDIADLEARMDAVRHTGIEFSQAEILRAYAVQLHLKQIARLLRASRVETSRAIGEAARSQRVEQRFADADAERSDGEQLRVDRHADHRIGAERVERIDFLLAANAAGHDELTLRELAQTRGGLNGKALHHSFAIHVRVEKCRDVRFELRNRIVGRERDLRLPALHGDAAILGVDAGDDALRANGGGELGGKLGVHCALG